MQLDITLIIMFHKQFEHFCYLLASLKSCVFLEMGSVVPCTDFSVGMHKLLCELNMVSGSLLICSSVCVWDFVSS